jgi:hypothetical protein
MKLEEAKHDLDEIFSQSLPLRLKHVQESETKQDISMSQSYIRSRFQQKNNLAILS